MGLVQDPDPHNSVSRVGEPINQSINIYFRIFTSILLTCFMFDHSKRSKDRHRMVMLVMLILMPTDAAADNAAATDQYVGPVDLVGPMGPTS